MSDSPHLPDLPIDLDDLIEVVQAARPEGEELAQVSTAVMLSEHLGELGDHLVGHFVDRARRAGASWTAIGASLGVTKQAAQKRFVPGAGEVSENGLFSRFTPRARAAIATAEKEARRMKNTQVGTEHIVLGLMAEADGIAAKALQEQGVDTKQLRQSVSRAGAPKAESRSGHIPFAPQSKKVLKVAVREALRRGHNYIGTEHLLLGVLADDKSTGSQVLLGLGVTEQRTSEWIDQTLADLLAARRI